MAKLLFQNEKELRRALKQIMGFYPHNLHYYHSALMHKSMRAMTNNERLEYLGDGILDAVVADILYRRYPKRNEGFLTQTRSAIVSRESLGNIARRIELDKLIKSNTQNNSHNSYMAGNAFEALVGAIYLDQGYERCHQFMSGLLKEMPSVSEKTVAEINPKSKLLEWCQKRHYDLRFDITERPDPQNTTPSPIFQAIAYINDYEIGTGTGYSKKQATQDASKKALGKLNNGDIRQRIAKAKAAKLD